MRLFVAAWVSLAGWMLALAVSAAAPTALDRYVAAPDTNFSYRLVNAVPGGQATTFILEMQSQAWLTTNEVNEPIWRHWLSIVKPNEVGSSTALLFITGGSRDRPAPRTVDGNLLHLARSSKSVVAELRDVPNQPLLFTRESEGRSEDAFIAYTWDRYLRTGDERWPARLPMTKSAVRALDAITGFCASPEGGSIAVDSFVVAGASKRGWTTWSTAIVDKRVVAIIPIVIDMLNIDPSFKHHYRAYGFWAPAIEDYTRQGVMDWMDTPEFRALRKIEDPFEYRERLTMPKFLINACGDQFFLPDSSQFYFQELPGPKYLRYVPNAGHSLKNSDAFQTLEACYRAVLDGTKLPQFSWELTKDGAIRVATKDKPAAATLWQAHNPNARDFRLDKTSPVWTSESIREEAGGVYVGRIETPTKGWSAFMVELTYPNRNGPPFKFTTDVRVLPETLPHELPVAQPKPPPAGR